MPDKAGSSVVVPLLALAVVLMITCVALNGVILSKGLDGQFLKGSQSESDYDASQASQNGYGDSGVSVNVNMLGRGGPPPATEGACLVDVSLQEEGTTLVGAPADWRPNNNIIARLPSASDCAVAVSPTWTVAGWNLTVVQLDSDAVFKPPTPKDNERMLIKILRGSLLDINWNGILRADGHWETHVVTAPNRPISMYIDNAVDEIKAGGDGAVFVFFKVTEQALSTPIVDMAASPATDHAGPFSENLVWNNFGNVYPDFVGVEFWNLAGIMLQESDASRLCYMQFWTMREDEDADGYHDHDTLTPENAFAEIHMAMYAANGVSGMQTTLPYTNNTKFKPNPASPEDTDVHAYNFNDQPEVQIAIPMPPGFAHGPLWSVDPATGEPTYQCLGGIHYPKHRWIISANGNRNNPLRYSMWVAFEHLPEDATVPLPMLTEWPNAYLQTTIDPLDCTPAN